MLYPLQFFIFFYLKCYFLAVFLFLLLFLLYFHPQSDVYSFSFSRVPFRVGSGACDHLAKWTVLSKPVGITGDVVTAAVVYKDFLDHIESFEEKTLLERRRCLSDTFCFEVLR
jgi:hypothetical protein